MKRSDGADRPDRFPASHRRGCIGILRWHSLDGSENALRIGLEVWRAKNRLHHIAQAGLFRCELREQTSSGSRTTYGSKPSARRWRYEARGEEERR